MLRLKILLYIIILFSLLFFSGCFNSNNNIYDFNIQKAIERANDGDIIYIKPGIYDETLTINKSIKLIGEGEDLTVIDCKNSGEKKHVDAVIINANNCTIKGLKITNTHVSSDAIGIKINSSDNILINNSISRFNNGIYLNKNTFNNKINNNKIFNNQNGIIFNISFYNNISNNFLFLNSKAAIYIEDTSNNNLFLSNNITENKYGIHFINGEDNSVIGNNIIKNIIGVYLCCGTQGNNLYKNFFAQNSKFNARDVRNNSWNNSMIGNYWDDYRGKDLDIDGIGDIPYNISGGINVDNYPLMTVL